MSTADVADVVDYLPEGLLVVDADRTLLLVNQRAEQLTGLPLRQHLGTDITGVLPLHDRDHRSWWTCQDPWGGLHTRTRFTEQLLHIPEGQAVLLAARVNRDANRAVSRLVITLRDPRTRERNDADSAALITTVAHELRAPLTSVRGFTRTLRQRWEQLQDEQKLWMLEAVESDADRLSRLVGELLDISRIDSGRLQLQRLPLEVLDVVVAQVDRLVAAGHDPERFVVPTAAPGASVWADPDRVQQVVGNLLENAIRHGAGKVTVSISVTDGHVELSIADEGKGVPEEQRELVFSRFWQGRAHGGSGLGLYVVRGLVEAHGGTVAVDDAQPGAVFTVRLPIGSPGAR